MIVCAACGTVAASTAPPYSWSLAVVEGHRSWTCTTCVRADLTRIETGANIW